MSQITWTQSYSVGHDAIDSQHKVLIDLINRLDTAERDGDSLRDVMERLDWYVREHFSLEEKLMKDAGYADLEAHTAEHRDFESWLKAAQSHMATTGMDQDFLATTVNDHLKDWLAKHILVVDMAYKGVLSD